MRTRYTALICMLQLNAPRNKAKKIHDIKLKYVTKLQRLQKAGIKFDIDLIEPKVRTLACSLSCFPKVYARNTVTWLI